MRPLTSMLLLIAACGPNGQGGVDGSKTRASACAPTASASFATAGVPVTVDLTPPSVDIDLARPRLRPVQLTAPTGGTVTLDGPIQLLTASGQPVTGVDPSPDPQTFFVRGDATGSAGLVLEPPAACTGEPATLSFEVRPAPELVGRPVAGPLGLTLDDAFDVGHTVSLALDGRDHPDRVGLPFDAWVVPHRSPEAWAADPILVDAADGPVSGTVGPGPRDEQVVALWSSDLVVPPGQTAADYDVVLDFGQDGQLDPGDLIDGLERPGFSVIADLALPGPHGVVSGEHSTGFWTTMRVYAPDADPGEPVPLVVISHGNGHDYTWYDYLGEHLASWGYAVISHRNDTEPGPVTAAGTTLENTDVFLRDADSLGLPVTVDGHRIAFIGHSRGGEGVVLAYNALWQGAAQVSEFTVDDVLSVHSIAPTLFESPDAANPHSVAYHLLAGSADGDVTGGVDSGVVQYFRIFQRGDGPHAVTYVEGADHNDFNCCGADDGSWPTVQGNPPLIGRQRAQDIARSYLLALLERDLRGVASLGAYASHNPEVFAPPATDAIVVTQSMAASGEALVIDDFQSNPDATRSSSGGAVSTTVDFFGEGGMDDNNFQLAWNAADPANGMTWSHNDANPDRAGILEWEAPGSIDWEVPESDRDWTGHAALSFRVGQTTRHPLVVAHDGPVAFSVALVDGSGTEVVLDAAPYGQIPAPYPRAGLGNGTGWSTELQTVHIPLADFTTPDPRVDLGDITTVRLWVGDGHGTPSGRLAIDDLEVLLR